MEVWRSGDALQAWRYGALEARCRRRNVETWSYGGLEACCMRSDVEV